MKIFYAYWIATNELHAETHYFGLIVDYKPKRTHTDLFPLQPAVQFDLNESMRQISEQKQTNST